MKWKDVAIGLGVFFGSAVLIGVMARLFGWSSDDIRAYGELVFIVPFALTMMVIYALNQRR